jgi:transitional endoplasmic reticulum ATPase
MNMQYIAAADMAQQNGLNELAVEQIQLDKISPLARLWALRILVLLGGADTFIGEQSFNPLWIAKLLGFSKALTSNAYTQEAAHTELRQLHQQAEQEYQQHQWHVSDDLQANIVMLKEILGLSDVECQVLAFVIVLHTERLLDDIADIMGNLTAAKAFKILTVVLNVPYDEVRIALSAQGRLIRSGLLTVQNYYPTQLRSKLELISEQLADKLLVKTDDPMALFAGTIRLSPAPELGLADYQHLQKSLDLLLPYLRQAASNKQKGINIFLHGVAGTGKSQLTRVIASILGQKLYEISSEDEEGDAITATGRLCAYRAAQSIFNDRPALLVFDEIEDVFNDTENGAGLKSTAQSRKAWVNHMLESNATPTFWISNSDDLDPAFIRRFDMVIEVKIPPKKQRQAMIAAQCDHLLDAECQSRLASAEHLAPAVLSRAHKVLNAIQGETLALSNEDSMTHLVSSTLVAQGYSAIKQRDVAALPEFYDTSFIQTKANLQHIAHGLQQHGFGRLCLYGPSGTGKTAFARWVAEYLDKPLLIKRGSDILSKWVGEMEQNLAKAFYEAEQQHAILLLDEVDSLLQDRSHAERSWEVSQVNEFLTQMETFSGIMITTTNRFESLDQAALRRFDFKLHFDYLSYQQRLQLLGKVCATLNINVMEAEIQNRLAALNKLTAGDFAIIVRQAYFHPFDDVHAVLAHLEDEMKLKGNSISKMGFVS